MKADFTPTQILLNEALIELFSTSECWGGYLEMQPTAEEVLYNARGYHQNGTEINVYPLLPPLKALLHQYAKETPGSIGFLTITVDLHQPTIAYLHTSAALEAAEDKARAVQQQAYRQQLRRQLSPAPFGPRLAAEVAKALARGRPFNYGHPAYCGMGFDIVDGHYRYGSVWEGGVEPVRTFPNRHDFVAWLTQQSDFNLAQLEFEEPSLWNNQTVTRARLMEFVGRPANSLSNCLRSLKPPTSDA